MPSKKTRINLTVDDDLNELLEKVSALTDTPKATFIISVLNDIKPMLNELAVALELASQKKSVVSNIARMSAEANAKTAVMNQEMADFYSKQLDLIEDTE